MTAVAEPLVSLSSSICNNTLTYNCIERHIHFDDDVAKLEAEYGALEARQKGIESRMQAVKSGEVVVEEVHSWLKNVENISASVKDILKEAKRVNWCKRGYLGKLLYRKINDVKDLHDKGIFSTFVQKKPQCGILISAKNIVGGSSSKKEEILWHLRNNEVGIIGVYGGGGVGKTLIMSHVNNDLVEGRGFDKVVWVNVSYQLDVSKLQSVIACALDEKLPENEEQMRRTSALKKIMEGMIERKEKFVLLLDNVWDDNFSLTEVGIPKPSRENGCKIVITSRLDSVLKALPCDETVKVELLSSEDSLNLFLDRANLVRDDVDAESMKIIEPLVKECACLPLSIVLIARALIGVTDIAGWRNAYHELKDDLHDDVHVTKVKSGKHGTFRQLRVSYDHLEHLNIQHCFLYCSLFSKGFAFSRKELIEGWIDEGLLTNRSRERTRANDMGLAILNKLVKDCLLEETDEYMNPVQMHDKATRNVDSKLWHVKAVKMHDVVRDMAIENICPSLGYMVKAGMKLTKVPDEDVWTKDLQKVSLMGNDIPKVPHGLIPKCRTLTTLILSYNPLSEIPESFFKELLGLMVLDLSETYIEALPNSISNLVNLSALRLKMCKRLKHLPSLAELRVLKKLDLHMAAIDKVPQGMENLKNLEYLDLSCPNLKEVPEEMLSKFYRLPVFEYSQWIF